MTQIHVPLFRDTLSPGVIALSISYAMQMIDGFGWTIRLISNIYIYSSKLPSGWLASLSLTALLLRESENTKTYRRCRNKRLKEQLNKKHLTQEADWESEVPLAENWPSTGEIKFDG